MIRRTAGEVLSSLEMRIARLERYAGRSTVSLNDVVPEDALRSILKGLKGTGSSVLTLGHLSWKQLGSLYPELQGSIDWWLKRTRLQAATFDEWVSRGWRQNKFGEWSRDGISIPKDEYYGRTKVAEVITMLEGFDVAKKLADDYVSGKVFFSSGSFPAPFPARKYYETLRPYGGRTITITNYFERYFKSLGGDWFY